MTPRPAAGVRRSAALVFLAAALGACALLDKLPDDFPRLRFPGSPAGKDKVATPPAPATPALTREEATGVLVEARALIAKGDYPSARWRLAAVVPAAARAGWLDLDSDANFVVGETLDRERASREAADAYARAREASRRLGDRAREIRNLNALSNARLDAGALEQGGQAAREAYALAKAAGDLRAEATAQNNIAEADRLAGRLDAARDGYEQALGLARQSGDQAAVASILINLGSTERRTGRLADARQHFSEVQALARSLNDEQADAYARWHLDQIEVELQTRGGQP